MVIIVPAIDKTTGTETCESDQQRKLRLGFLDDVATVWASLSVLGYLTPALFAFYHRHKNLSQRIDLSCALPLDNLDMTVPIGIPRASAFPCTKGCSVKKAPRPPCTSRQLAKAHPERFPRPGISKPQDLWPENHEHQEETALLDAACGGES